MQLKKIIVLISACQVMLACGADEVSKSTQVTGFVTTLAGSTSGYADGLGTTAKFNNPSGLTVDANGDIFVADFANNAIRKITQDGTVETFAGGTEGNANGSGTNAQFNGPHDIEIGADGNFYVVEVYANRIRKVTPDGAVSNFAGSVTGELDYVNATGNEARFYSPRCIAVGPDGMFYVTEFSNRIRKITPVGAVTTFAGSGIAGTLDGTGESATFDDPMGIATDNLGNVYVAQYQTSALRKITPDSQVKTITGGGDAHFLWPADLAVDALGNCFVGEVRTFTISMLSSKNEKSVVSGSSSQGFTDGDWNVARFDTPYALHFDKTEYTLYVSDKHRIRKVVLSRK